MDAGYSLIGELEEAIQAGSKDKRVDALRRITDLFLSDVDRLNEQQIEVFDDVLGHLIKRIEGKALAELSRRLGPIANAPIEVVRRLARDDDIAIAEPILTRSVRLNTNDLVEIANTKSQAHLLAISGRQRLEIPVTDVLLERGDNQVIHRLADNAGAKFSEAGFTALVSRSEKDDQLAEKVGLRLDVPLQLFRQLLLRATEAVRSRLLAAASPASRDHIQRILTNISEELGCEADINREHDYARAKRLVLAMHSRGELTESAVFEFAKAKKCAELTAAISTLCAAPFDLVKDLLQSAHREAFLIPCKAAGLEWPTVRLILSGGSRGYAMSDQDINRARPDYFKLSQKSAQRVLRFWQVRQTTTNSENSSRTPHSPPTTQDATDALRIS